MNELFITGMGAFALGLIIGIIGTSIIVASSKGDEKNGD